MAKTIASILGGLLILSSAVLCFATDNPPADTLRPTGNKVISVNPASKARIKFESDQFDFGSIPRGSKVAHVFKFRNIGQDTLKVTNVKPTCGCTTAPLSSNLIAPGEEANIKAYFNSQKFNGRVHKQIYVDSSDPISPYLKVSFTAIINDPLQNIEVTPMEANLDTVRQDQPAKTALTLTNISDSKIDLAIVEVSSPTFIKASLSDITLEPKGTAKLNVELAPGAEDGELSESITFEAKGGETSRFSVPVMAIITK